MNHIVYLIVGEKKLLIHVMHICNILPLNSFTPDTMLVLTGFSGRAVLHN